MLRLFVVCVGHLKRLLCGINRCSLACARLDGRYILFCMGNWIKEAALAELRSLIEEVNLLQNQRAHSALHTRWEAKTFVFLREVFGANSFYVASFASFDWQFTGTYYFHVTWGDPNTQEKNLHHRAYLEQLDSAKGLLEAALGQLERSDIESVYEGKNTAPETSAIIQIINLAEHKLRKIIRQKPAKEKEVQDAFESLLIASDVEYSREVDHIEYSSKAYIPDFVIAKLDLAVEMKLCREGAEKELIAQVNDDILAYQTKYGNLFFVVYDLGFIRDVERFTGSFEQHKNVVVKIVKH